MKKRVIATLLLMLMIAGALSACKQEDQNEPGALDQVVTNTSEQDATTKDTPIKVEKEETPSAPEKTLYP